VEFIPRNLNASIVQGGKTLCHGNPVVLVPAKGSNRDSGGWNNGLNKAYIDRVRPNFNPCRLVIYGGDLLYYFKGREKVDGLAGRTSYIVCVDSLIIKDSLA
jgi:hypothetical protein